MTSITRPFFVLFALLGVLASSSAEIPVGAKAPELVGTQWTSSPTSLAKLRGKVVLLHFWTFGCINCKHNLPVYSRIQNSFDAKQVTTIGVHTPETAEEHSFENLKRAVPRLAVKFNSLFDGENRNWDRYGVHYWPTLFVVDKHGVVRGVWIGELNYGGQNGEAEVDNLVAKLLKE